MKLHLVVSALVLAPGCRTIETREVSSTPTPLVRKGMRERMWHVLCAGEFVGHVVQFQERTGRADSLYVVRNTWHQDLGLIDSLGRAFRYLPHHEEPAWVGSGTVSLGAERILGASGACELIEVDPDAPQPDASPAEAGLEGPGRPAERPAAAPSPGLRTPARPDGGLPQSR